MKTRTQNKKIFIAFFSAVIFQLCALAQTSQGDENLQRVFPPSSGTFYLLSADSKGVIYPPYPCSPYPSDWEIPVYLRADGKYLVADTPEDAAQLINTRFSLSENQEAVMRTTPDSLPPLPASGSQGGTPQVTLPTLNTNGLWLEIFPGVSAYNNNVSNSTILIHNTKAGGEYMLQSSSVPNPDLWDFETSFVAETNIFVLIGNLGQDQYTSGFFRVVDISPVAGPDFFQVQQNSINNLLDILINDYTPDDDYFFVRAVFYSDHGMISCEEENLSLLEPFRLLYQPDSGFYGIDPFEYCIENYYGGEDCAPVTVFVNQTGNGNPIALSNIILTMQPDVYSAGFNVFTNVSDPDNDTVCLFALTTPKYGTASFDDQGNVTYNRNTNYFGSDRFSYIVTDGKGGLLRDDILVQQIEHADNPGIPIQWLLHYGMSPSYTNTFCDPDSDGLNNLAEFLLGTNPRKSDNPLDLVTLTNNTTLEGYAELPLIGIREHVLNQPITLLVNGVPSGDVHIAQNLDRSLYLYWDTMHLTNGNYTLQARFDYYQDNTSYTSHGIQKTVTIHNPMRFERINDQFGSTLFISATMAEPIADYVIQFYDEEGYYLTGTSGSVTNGQLQLSWDLCNTNGVQISYGNISASFMVRLWMCSDQCITNMFEKIYVKEGRIHNADKFTVAWGWDDYSSKLEKGREDIMQHSVVDLLGNPLHSNPYDLLPKGGNVPLGAVTFRYDTDVDKTTLTNALTQGANFFWFGHGLETMIFGNFDKSRIGGFEILDLLENYAWLSRAGKPKNNKKPYKLVVLNSCNSAGGRLMEPAFGFEYYSETSTDTVLDYILFERTPKAYVGWREEIHVPSEEDAWFGATLQGHYKNLMADIWSRWMSGQELNQCLSPCNDLLTKYRFPGIESWRISGCFNLRKFD